MSVVELHPGKLVNAQSVMDHASNADLDKVAIIGITRSGENYFQSSDNSTLCELAWMHFAFGNSLHRMVEK